MLDLILTIVCAGIIGASTFASIVGAFQRSNVNREYRRIVNAHKARKVRKAREQWVAWLKG